MSRTEQMRGGRVPTIHRPLLFFFRHIVRGQFRRRFHAVRVVGAERMRRLRGPAIVYANHSGWWDPMVAFLLGAALMPGEAHYAPMDGKSLETYKILRRLGVFPVELTSARGAVQFLRTGEAILRAGGVVWVTPQGRFADVRERPLEFKAGMAALAARVPGCTVQPMAIEYVFWNERTPEALLMMGEPMVVADGESAETLEGRFREALERTMEELRGRAMSRRAESFDEVLLRGRSGVGGFYAMGKRVTAWVRGRAYRPEHTGSGATAVTAREMRETPGGRA